MRISFGSRFAFDIDDGWTRTLALSLVDKSAGPPGFSLTVTNEQLPAGSSAAGYAAAQGEVLQRSLKDYAEIRASHFDTGRALVPVREYSWRQEGAEIAQCQAYFVEGQEAWTLTFTATAEAYPALRPQIPALIRSVLSGGGG